MATCPNGHEVPAGNQFCTACGLQVLGANLPSPGLPLAAPIPPTPRRRPWVFVGVGALALVIVGVLLFVVLGSQGGAAPLTRSTAEDALLSPASLPIDMVLNTESVDISPNTPFDPDTTPACTTVKGVSRLTDLDTSMPLGTPAFPEEAGNITVFVGNDFKDPTDNVVSTFEERIIVFPTEEEASAYLAEIRSALDACPVSEIIFSNDGTTFRSVDEYRDIQQSDGRLSWKADSVGSMDAELDLLDFTFRSTTGNDVVQRGPNVLVVDWYQDEDTTISLPEFEAASSAAIEKFLSVTG